MATSEASAPPIMARITSRWTIALLIFAITVINYADRGILGVVAPILISEFHLTIKQFGIIGSGFGWGYVLFAFLGGKIVSRLGAKRTYMYFSILWSFFVVLFAGASGFAGLLILRIFFGASEGVVFPAGTQLLGSWFPVGERGKAASVMPLAIPLGTLLITPLAIWLTGIYGWRAPFIFLGALGPIWALFCKIYIFDKPPLTDPSAEVLATASAQKAGDNRGAEIPWSRIVRSRSLWIATLAAFASAFFLYFLLNFLPLFLVREKHIELSHIAYMSALPWIFMALGAAVSGVFSDFVFKRTGNLRLSRSYLAGGCLILAGISIAATLIVSSVFAVVCLISLASFINFLAQPALFAIPIDLFPDHAGPAMSLYTGFGSSAGIFAPLVTGLIVNATGSFYFAFVLIAALPIVCGGLLIAACNPREI
jgi:ACS family hexuronate transporter-like MFS transporter